MDLVPVVLPSEDGFGCTRDVSVEWWTVLNGGDRSSRSTQKEQTQRRKIQPFGDCWIEQAMRCNYIEATRVLTEDLKRRMSEGSDMSRACLLEVFCAPSRSCLF